MHRHQVEHEGTRRGDTINEVARVSWIVVTVIFTLEVVVKMAAEGNRPLKYFTKGAPHLQLNLTTLLIFTKKKH